MFRDLIERLLGRFFEYQQTNNPDVILSDSVTFELDEAFQRILRSEPVDVELARYTVGWMYHLRAGLVVHGAAEFESARSIVVCAPLVDRVPAAIPEPLRNILGESADPEIQDGIAGHFLSEFKKGGDPILLDAAIVLFSAVSDAEDSVNSRHYARLYALGTLHEERFALQGSVDDLERAVEFGERAAKAAPYDHPESLANLAAMCHDHFSRTGSLEFLDKNIKFTRAAIGRFEENEPRRVTLVELLGHSYRIRFLKTNQLSDLGHAVEFGTLAVEATPLGARELPTRLSALGHVYEMRFDHVGTFDRIAALEDLKNSLECNRRAVEAATPNDARWWFYMAVLGGSYWRRYHRVTAIEDLEQAISCFQQALNAAPRDDDSIEYSDDVDTLGKPGELSGMGLLGVLGLAYERRFDRNHAIDDLRQAVVYSALAVEVAKDDSTRRVTILLQLERLVREFVALTGDNSFLEWATELNEEALRVATELDEPDRARLLSVRGSLYLSSFSRIRGSGDPEGREYLDKAISATEQALLLLSNDCTDSEYVGRLSTLLSAYRMRAEFIGMPVSRGRLSSLHSQLKRREQVWPEERLDGFRKLGSIALSMGEYKTAAELLGTAVSLLPSIAPREIGWSDQEYRIGSHTGLVEEAIAAHCSISDTVRAVEVAELGRGIMLASRLDSHIDLTELNRKRPVLFDRFQDVRRRINNLDTSPESAESRMSGSNNTDWVSARKQLWSEYDELLTEIRDQPGLSQFLQIPRFDEIQAAAADGPVILVSSDRSRSDAIIVMNSRSPKLVQLPDLKHEDVIDYATKLLTATRGDEQELSAWAVLYRRRILREILSWLWSSAVEPILAEVLLSDPDHVLPRVWWMPTGLLGLFPFHAAERPGEPGALDKVVSSYTPTLRTLAHIRGRQGATVRRHLAVALTEAEGKRKLKKAIDEAEYLRDHFPQTQILAESSATTANVRAALSESTWAHFACHASTDVTSPSGGGLDLHDGRLGIEEIGALRLNQAELAYLSACYTADRGVRSSDECLHLASAFQLSGFRHVIASLWPIKDQISADAAIDFYEKIGNGPTADRSARILHEVSRDLRDTYRDNPEIWAPLIHSGP